MDLTKNSYLGIISFLICQGGAFFSAAKIRIAFLWGTIPSPRPGPHKLPSGDPTGQPWGLNARSRSSRFHTPSGALRGETEVVFKNPHIANQVFGTKSAAVQFVTRSLSMCFGPPLKHFCAGATICVCALVEKQMSADFFIATSVV